MFKLESYITPVILSYVEKYVKNFKPEQSQVSLWGGDASFQNLDLRLEVLEEQLNLPFTFVSGHIHELLIHVPWVKITSEPIVITINTIECILNLKEQQNGPTTVRSGSAQRAIQEEAPPGYIKSIVTKVINNITINCNNLILKLVEEDIVLSVNVRFLSMQTVNGNWEAAFTDVSSYEVTLRKIIKVEDMTLCLDKMDTAGKIETYQDPVLYRCSMIIRLMMNYHSNLANYPTLTRFDLHCEKMEFSMTEQQLPMLLRLIALITDLHAKQLVVRKDKAAAIVQANDDDRGEVVQDDEIQVLGALPEVPSWGGWAWSAVTSFLPVEWDSDWSNEQQIASTGYMLHVGVYIDDAALTFKTVERLQEQLFYKSRKIRYNSFLTIQVTGAVMSMLVKGISMSNVRFGIGSIRLHPRGPCSCGYQEVVDDNDHQPPLYMIAGSMSGNDYLKDSLFDKNAMEHDVDVRNYYRQYNIDHHLATVTVSSMLDRCPALGIDVFHSIEIPDDISLEKLAEFGTNFEYSNFPERKIIRYVIGNLKIRLCSGLMHRIESVKSAAKYDYNPEADKKHEPKLDELPPVTVEEYEALRENVSIVEKYFNVNKVAVEFQLNDHGSGRLPSTNQRASGQDRTRGGRRKKKDKVDNALSDNPHLSIEIDEIVGSIVEPMYTFRLASCASRQGGEVNSEMLNDCYSIINIQLSGVQSQLYLTKNCRILLVMPCNGEFSKKSLIYPQYWKNTSLIHDVMKWEMDAITFTGTKPKIMSAIAIATSITDPTDIANNNPLFFSSLFNDACNERESVYLELSLENIRCERAKSSSRISIKINVDSMKIFALNDTQQAFILSGPESHDTRESTTATTTNTDMLLTLFLEYSERGLSLAGENDDQPPILSFRVSEMRLSIDPLVRQWFKYTISYHGKRKISDRLETSEQPVTDETLSDAGTRKKKFPTLHDSVHSLSDKEKKKSSSRTEWSKGISATGEEVQKTLPPNDQLQLDSHESGIFGKITDLYPLWRKLVLYGYFGHLLIYIPTTTMDGIGAAGIEMAKDRALNSDKNLEIFAIKAPTVLIHSVNVQFEELSKYLELSRTSHRSIWRTRDYHSFPWTLSLSNLRCYTLRKKEELGKNVIDKVDLTATIDIATKHGVLPSSGDLTDVSLAGLGLCVYVDTSPVVISISEQQVPLLRSAGSDMTKILNLVYRGSRKMPIVRAETEVEDLFSDIPKSPSSYTQLLYAEDTSTLSTISTSKDEQDKESESVVITAMIQWTITKVALKLYVTDRMTGISTKLLLELEDIITTLDWQPIYLKFKSKITTATICHYTRKKGEAQHWELGKYGGLIMCGRESNPEQMEDSGFFSVTLTTAQSGNVHTRWGAAAAAQKHQKSHKNHVKRERPLLAEGHITEIDVNLQMVDVILPLGILNKFVLLVKPFIQSDDYFAANNEANDPIIDKTSLPLIYLEFKGMNLMVPTFDGLLHGLQHDLFIIQLDGISITPNAENPICRTILRSDIYQLAAQSNILNIPGSAVEDRQYQVNIKGISACTTTWTNYQRNITKRMSQSYLYTMNENPALEWNNLASDSNLEPQFSTCPLMSRFDVRLIIAPAVVLNPSTVVCGSAFEMTCLTDIDVSINLDQIKLLWAMYSESSELFCDFLKTPVSDDTADRASSPVRQFPQGIVRSNEETSERDYTADSGVDFESSSVNFMFTRKVASRHERSSTPSEILANCGTVTISLYSVVQTPIVTMYPSSTNNDDITDKSVNSFKIKATEESKTDEKSYFKSMIIRVMLNEPNVYISQLDGGTEKMQISCFDFALSLGNVKTRGKISSEDNENFPLIETKSGDVHPVTGIPPSFLVIKCTKSSSSTSMQLSIDIGRPTRINCSIPALRQIEYIKNEISACFIDDRFVECCEAFGEADLNKSSKFETPDLNFTTKQIVVCWASDCGAKILTSVSNSSGNTWRSAKPRKIFGDVSLNALVLSAEESGEIATVLLKPCCCQVTGSLLWETWQADEADPLVEIQADYESVHFELGPRQIILLESLVNDYNYVVNYFVNSTIQQQQTDNTMNSNATATTEQHYKDDLKAGAFQFLEGYNDELPLPYQVVFHTKPAKTMAWRYPQPRVITGIGVAPIPFQISEYEDDDLEDDSSSLVCCVLEYWSESHMSYQRYVEFSLSETEASQAELPSSRASQAVASIWRVMIMPSLSLEIRSQSPAFLISPQVLAACLRIDSYFNPSIIPNFQSVLNIGAIHVSLFNYSKFDLSTDNLGDELKKFHLRGPIAEEQCFGKMEKRATSIVYNRWSSSSSSLIEISGTLKFEALDYNFLRMQEVLDNFETKIQISLSNEINVSMECNPFTIKIGPSLVHNLAISTNLWISALEKRQNDNNQKPILIVSRLIVANDTNIEIRFSQTGASENIPLNSRQCCFYYWRHTNNRTMRLAIESNGWIWSQAFSVKKNGKQLVTFGNSLGYPIICATIVSISATQKLLTLSGLLVLTNQLHQNFEMKLVKYCDETPNGKPIVSDKLHTIGANDRPPSIVLDNNARMAMRLRFATSTNLSWTGDIPLKPNSKWGQPWLVKVPLQERGQFLSIWARIVTEKINGITRVLAILSPLYMIKSYLPVAVTVQIETPSLRTFLSTTINGRGERQQLYCPGTFEHSHQLTFQFESGISASNPYVPLSYSSVEQRKFFKRPENEDIDMILSGLENQVKISEWPFQTDDLNVWIPAEQPHTHVQVKYQDAGLVSSTLLLELQPWCFILNTLGCQVSLIAEDIELCKVPHRGVITPPKLEGTFHIRLNIGGNWYVSPALQLARPDWSQGFYMPKIRGLIPLEGYIRTLIDCGPTISIVGINSKMHQDMRVVRVTTSHVICNLTGYEIGVICLAVNETRFGLDIPDNETLHSFTVSPVNNQSEGTPIVQWCTVESGNITENTVALYVCLSRDGYRWSCPVNVNQIVHTRRCISLSDQEAATSAIPVVVTTQEDKGTIFILIHLDDHPQLYIENSCPFDILVGETSDGGICQETAHFMWMCQVDSGALSYYSTPSSAAGTATDKLPSDAQTIDNQLPKLVLSALPHHNDNQQSSSDKRRNVSWSRPIITSQVANGPIEQYIRLPAYGDVKLLMEKRCHTIRLRILCMSQVDISARDIRSRLIFKENAPANNDDDDDAIAKLGVNVAAADTIYDDSSRIFYDQLESDIADNNQRKDETKVVSKIAKRSRMGSLTVYIRGINVIIMKDLNERGQRVEVASLCLSDVLLMTISNPKSLSVRCFFGDLQFDNQMFIYGGFDFPVVLINQHPYTARGPRFTVNSGSKNLIDEIEGESLIVIDCSWLIDDDTYACKHVRIKIGPTSAYIEDTFISQLLEYTTSMLPPCLISPIETRNHHSKIGNRDTERNVERNFVSIPEYIMLESVNIRSPVRLQKFTIEPISLLLSVHTSVRLYVALDHSPLYFGTFERRYLQTTPYRLGNALTMHYLSGAIFGAGWVVGSLEILGSPGGFAQALGYGLRDFIALPMRGLLNGPWGFLIGITHGSASLMKHLTAGTVNSVTKLASSVARNLDRLTLDEEHLQRQEESRRNRPQGMAQGLYQGLTGFGMSLLAAVAGLAHHPLQQVLSGEATPRGLMTGVGLGIVGAVTKPLSGAAELVALTGQGLLEGTGWNPLPAPRQIPVLDCQGQNDRDDYAHASNSSPQYYTWRLLPMVTGNVDGILHIVNVHLRTYEGAADRPVTLILTREAILLIDPAEHTVEKMYALKDLTYAEHISDPNLFCLHCLKNKNQPMRSSSPIEFPEMDEAMRARVEEFVRGSSTGCASLSATTSYVQSETIPIAEQPAQQSNPENTLTFYVPPDDDRNYLLLLFKVAKRQGQKNDYAVL